MEEQECLRKDLQGDQEKMVKEDLKCNPSSSRNTGKGGEPGHQCTGEGTSGQDLGDQQGDPADNRQAQGRAKKDFKNIRSVI